MPLWSYTTRRLTRPYQTIGLSSAFLQYTLKVKATATENLIAYWPLADLSGSTAVDESGLGRNGAYTSVTLSQTGIGDGRTAAAFNGSASVANVFTSGLQGAFNGSEGTLALWAQVSGAGVWTDGTQRRICRIAVDGNNSVLIARLTTNNQLRWTYAAGGTTKSITKTGLSTTAWMHLVITWSKTADLIVAYFNGVQESTNNLLGTWAGSLAATLNVIGGTNTTPLDPWSGSVAHVALWTTPLSAAQVASLAGVP